MDRLGWFWVTIAAVWLGFVLFALGSASDCGGNENRHAQWKRCTACEVSEQTRCVVDTWSTDYILTHCAGAKAP